MIFSRDTHLNFLETELKAQTERYKQKLDTPAVHLLLNRGEVFVSQFLTIKNGEMILKFSNKRALPRKRDFLYCMLLPKELRDYHKWGDMTYGDLVKQKYRYTEISCIWHAPSNEEGYSIAGFHRFDTEFAEVMKDAKDVILVLGPQKPPFEYIMNLEDVVRQSPEDEASILDNDYTPHNWEPYLLDEKNSTSQFILAQLKLTPTIILQGPPGTGKSYMIAELCKELCEHKCSVLVAALTNRALIEIVEKPALESLLEEKRVFKTSVSGDEEDDFPTLQRQKEIVPRRGHLLLATYHAASGATKSSPVQFDYVIMDEASQALLAMFEVSRTIGKHNLWIGDVKQLPPVVETDDEKIIRRGHLPLVEGFNTLTECLSMPIYQLTETFRLPPRAADYTKFFYKGHFTSKSTMKNYRINSQEYNKYFHPQGGPTLIKTDLETGDTAPMAALLITSMFVDYLSKSNKKLNIAVLSCMVETVRKMQSVINQASIKHKNLIVETVARVQGLTTDVTIFVIPNSATRRSLNVRLFNVATSRAQGYTIIITDKEILQCRMPDEVRMYLEKLDKEFSFYMPFQNPSQRAKELPGSIE